MKGISDRMMDNLFEKSIDAWGQKYAEFYGSPITKAIIDLATPTQISVYRDAYRKEISQLNSTLQKLKVQVQLMNKTAATGWVGNRSDVQIGSAISDLQADLEYHIDLANGYYQGMVTERELPESECYECVAVAHRSLIGLAATAAHIKIAPNMKVTVP